MDKNIILTYFPFLAGFGIILTAWSKIKDLLHRLFNLLICEVDLTGDGAITMIKYLNNNARIFNFGNNKYYVNSKWVKQFDKSLFIPFVSLPHVFQVVKFENSYFLIKNTSGKDKTTEESYDNRIKIVYLRRTLNIEKMLIKACEELDKFHSREKRFGVFRITGENKKTFSSRTVSEAPRSSSSKDYDYNPEGKDKPLRFSWEEMTYSSVDKSNFDNYIFCDESQKLFDEARFWLKSKEWYAKRGISWRRGAMIYGLPGVGKSSLVKAIAEKLGIPIHLYDLGSMNNNELIQEWANSQRISPCIVLIEDIDNTFEKRKNIIKNSELTFDCLLNCLGGVNSNAGIFTIITTNHIEKLDPALIREGRIDSKIELKLLSKEARTKMAKKILVDNLEIVDTVVNQGEEMSGASFNELCTKTAMELYWNKFKKWQNTK